MPTEVKSKTEPWLVYAAVAVVLFPSLYAMSWGPVASLAAHHATLGEIADTAYAPMAWLENNTALSASLGWYWELFSSLRPKLPSAYGPRDDLQYFPPGPEFKLTREIQAIEEYCLRQQCEPIPDQPPEPEEGIVLVGDDDDIAREEESARLVPSRHRRRYWIYSSENTRDPNVWRKLWFLDSPLPNGDNPRMMLRNLGTAD